LGTSCTIRPSHLSGPNETLAIAATSEASGDQRIAPGKFIPTFAILYGHPKSEQALKDAARFD